MIIDNPIIDNFYHVLFSGKKEEISGTQIERYFNDFRHVRVVPYYAIRDRTVNEQKPINHFATAVQSYQSMLQDGVELNTETFTNNPQHGSIEFFYRWTIKMNWLINDIRKRGCREPIWGVVRPNQTKFNEVEYTYHVHPGTFRINAFELMDLNQDCVVFDAFEVFHDFPKVSLADILDLYDDPAGTIVEVSILQQDTSYNTPQVLNMKSKGINCSMTPSLKKHEKKVRHMFEHPIQIFIGYDSRHGDATNVCHNSIIDRLNRKTSLDHVKIHHLDTSKIPGWTREYKDQSTEFSYSRFLVPYLSDYKGISIFVDDDFIFRQNPLALALYLSDEHSVACVKHDFQHKFDTKFNNEKDVWYPRKLWSSLMVFNNSHPDCKKLTLDTVQRESGKFLHQFEWTDEGKIADLPKKWNWCEGYDYVMAAHKSHALHWTRGGPWVEGMDTRHIALLELYDYHRYRSVRDTEKEFTYQARQVSMLDMRNYYDIENPIDIAEDGTRICQEINRDVR